jgi:hypothetical protein
MSTHQEQVESAISDPTRHYARPMDVVQDESLDIAEKRKILESWKKDAELLSTPRTRTWAAASARSSRT